MAYVESRRLVILTVSPDLNVRRYLDRIVVAEGHQYLPCSGPEVAAGILEWVGTGEVKLSIEGIVESLQDSEEGLESIVTRVHTVYRGKPTVHCLENLWTLI